MTTDHPLITYIRVSTSQQGRSGLGIEAQRQTLAHFAMRCSTISCLLCVFFRCQFHCPSKGPLETSNGDLLLELSGGVCRTTPSRSHPEPLPLSLEPSGGSFPGWSVFDQPSFPNLTHKPTAGVH